MGAATFTRHAPAGPSSGRRRRLARRRQLDRVDQPLEGLTEADADAVERPEAVRERETADRRDGDPERAPVVAQGELDGATRSGKRAEDELDRQLQVVDRLETEAEPRGEAAGDEPARPA